MKNIFFSLLVLSSVSFLYSSEKLDRSHKQNTYSAYIDQDIDFDMEELEEEARLDGMAINGKYSTHGWKVLKGAVGLWFGTKFFLNSGTGVLFLLMCPNDMLSKMMSESPSTLSPLQKFITNRLVLLFFCSTIMVFSAWLLKRSATNLYQGIYATEEDLF